MRTDLHVGIFDLIIFLGIFQGLFISWFFIKNSKHERHANLYQGLLLMFLSFAIFEEFLNNTGYIVHVLPLTNFSEPLNFTFAPLFYLYIRSSLEPNKKQNIWVHFIVAVFWLFYMYYAFIQPNEVKYNSYIQTKHPDWDYINVIMAIDDDPLRIRYFINYLTLLQFILYMGTSIWILLKKFKSLNQSLFKTNNELLIVLRNTTIHFIIIILVFIVTKVVYGMRSDVGGYWIASYIAVTIYATSYQILNRSDFFDHPRSFLSLQLIKYQKSSLEEDHKKMILSAIKKQMESSKYFTNNLASLSGLAKLINESTHHVSQVINEKLSKNFYELLAGYRIDYAIELLQKDSNSKLTIEELTEIVGYNSKSSFNTAFKKHTGQTPSEFRKSLNYS